MEAKIRIVETDYNHGYIEISTEGWSLVRRWNWIKAIITAGDIVEYPKHFEHVDLRTPRLVVDKHNRL